MAWWRVTIPRFAFLLLPFRRRTSLSTVHSFANASYYFTLPAFLGIPSASIFWSLAFIWPLRQPRDQAKMADDITKQLFSAALRSVRLRNFQEADRLLHDVLHHLYTSHQNGHMKESDYVEQRTRVYSEMANVHLALGQHSEAERLIRQTIQDASACGIPLDSSMIVELSLKLALIYQQMELPKPATLGFTYCISTQESKLSKPLDPEQKFEELALLGMSHNYFSKFLFHNGHSATALKHAQQALEIARQIYSSNHPNYLNLLCDIAVILLHLGRIDEARVHLSIAQELAEQQLADVSLPNRDEIRTCLVHILLQRIQLELQQDNSSSAYAKELIIAIDKLLQTFDAPRDLRDQYERLSLKVAARP